MLRYSAGLILGLRRHLDRVDGGETVADLKSD
jgi:hypothetical protein